MACSQCKLPYPAYLVTSMFVATPEESGYVNVCGICALEISNALSGIERKEFDGEMAEVMRQDAIEWRRKHPNARPV